MLSVLIFHLNPRSQPSPGVRTKLVETRTPSFVKMGPNLGRYYWELYLLFFPLFCCVMFCLSCSSINKGFPGPGSCKWRLCSFKGGCIYKQKPSDWVSHYGWLWVNSIWRSLWPQRWALTGIHLLMPEGRFLIFGFHSNNWVKYSASLGGEPGSNRSPLRDGSKRDENLSWARGEWTFAWGFTQP